MTNNRIYFATQGVGIAPQDSTTFTGVHGLQSVGITTTFNLEQIFEIGQLSIYENIEDIPEIEVTMEKVLDGWPLIYHLATRGYASTSLAGRSARKCNIALNIYPDTVEAASGTPDTEIVMSGMYVSSISYNLPVDGSCTESVTFVGNNKVWRSGDYLLTGTVLGPAAAGYDSPQNVTVSGGVQRRENVLFGSKVDGSVTLLPGELEGISSSGTNDQVGGIFAAHVQNLSVSTDLGREELRELGRRGPYFRFVTFPIEVTTEIEITSSAGDQINATEAGIAGSGYNLTDQRILIVLQDSTKIDLGVKNKLASITYGGGDATGGNVSTTYTYTTFNDFNVTHNADPIT